MARIANKAEVLAHMKEDMDRNFKVAAMLLAAHTAAVGYCIKALSDGKTGIGVIAVIFSVGFIAAVANYACLFFARMVSRNAIRDDRDPNDEPSAAFLALAAWRSLWISGLALVSSPH